MDDLYITIDVIRSMSEMRMRYGLNGISKRDEEVRTSSVRISI